MVALELEDAPLNLHITGIIFLHTTGNTEKLVAQIFAIVDKWLRQN
jgi:hypothetical protein